MILKKDQKVSESSVDQESSDSDLHELRSIDGKDNEQIIKKSSPTKRLDSIANRIMKVNEKFETKKENSYSPEESISDILMHDTDSVRDGNTREKNRRDSTSFNIKDLADTENENHFNDIEVWHLTKPKNSKNYLS